MLRASVRYLIQPNSTSKDVFPHSGNVVVNRFHNPCDQCGVHGVSFQVHLHNFLLSLQRRQTRSGNSSGSLLDKQANLFICYWQRNGRLCSSSAHSKQGFCHVILARYIAYFANKAGYGARIIALRLRCLWFNVLTKKLLG